MLVEQEDVMAIEEENKQKKAELKEEKRKVGDIQKEMEKLSRQLCEDYEDLTIECRRLPGYIMRCKKCSENLKS